MSERSERLGTRADALGYGRGWLLRNLPVVMQEDDLGARVVTMFEDIATSVRHAVVSADNVADLATTTPGMVRYLGSWVAAPSLEHTDDALRRRRIVAAAGATLSSRGTAGALRTLLEAVTGGPVTVADPGGVHRDGGAPTSAVHVVVRVASSGGLRAHEIVALVREELPADVTCAIWIGEEQAWPTTTATTPTTAAR